MKKELQDKLYEKYPKIFKQKDDDMTTTCLCWGLECGDGWFDLIERLCDSLQFHTDNNNYPQVEATQVKEKFGTLSFYTSGADEYLSGYINFAESMSATICETCGTNQNVTQTKGWIKTICKKCLEEKEKKDDN
jgi:hypothetical protein